MATKTKPAARVSLKDLPPPASVFGVMNRKQVCQALGGISVRKLSMMISASEFPRPDFRIGESTRWSVTMFNEWVEEHRDKPTN